MKAIPNILAAAVLACIAPIAFSQEGASKSPPANAPAAAPASSEPAKGSQARKDLDEAMDTIRSSTAERREQALASGRRVVDDLDRQMQRLQEQMDQGWERMSQAARMSSRAQMADLRKRRNALAEWFGGMRHSSATAWIEVRGGFVKSYNELAEALRKARAEFEKGQKAARPPEKPKDDAKK